MDIRKHRFTAPISTTSKVHLDKKRKSKTRRSLKRELQKKLQEN